ncbi:MAG: hypothetical protein P8J01_07685 [Acidimicrobiales bacterium]|nr:hypothetical protein [Acidimicrobiales bacterium]
MRLLRRVVVALLGGAVIAAILRLFGSGKAPSESGGWRDLETE